MLLYQAAIRGESPRPSDLRDKESRASARRQRSFEEEFQLILKRYRVAFDERYVWG
jgi:hypothetical protein